jgi:nicotinamidase-related amidase
MLTLDRATSLLLVIDMQVRLHPAIAGGDAALREAIRLAEIARLLGVPVWATEHCPGAIGPLLPELAVLTERRFEKTSFDACRTPDFHAAIRAQRPDIVLCGYEAHVCVLQTAMGLLAMGKRVWLVRDAVGSRLANSRRAALARMAQAGVRLVTTEMAGFEWAEDAGHPQWRPLLKLVK